MNWQEVNFDGLIGPTHNYAGLSFGNIASSRNRRSVSTPRAAALQGLEKMRAVMREGIVQGVLPPQPRPDFALLEQLGFSGTCSEIIRTAADSKPVLLAAAYSASSMWTANAATVSPSIDCADSRLHLTPANLISTLHRSIEASQTYRLLKFLFANEQKFQVHQPLPASLATCDEGAANHTRLCGDPGSAGLELFVFGRDALQDEFAVPQEFPARQTLQASQAVARKHLLDDKRCVFMQQHPAAIDAGAFHNDVVSVGHRNVFMFHELAFNDSQNSISLLQKQFQSICGAELCCVRVTQEMLPLEEAVRTYLFNSQILSRADGSMLLLCPDDCLESHAARNCLEAIVSGDNPIESYACLNLKQSMMNGGGPACLRLRVLMNDEQLASMHQGVLLDELLVDNLQAWVNRHYREQLAPEDLHDPKLADESREALSELEELLDLPKYLLGR